MPATRSTLALLALAWLPALARADVVELESGGKIVGTIANQDAPDRSKIVVDLSDGGRVTLNRSDVRRTIPQSAEAEKYERRVATVPDTAEANWELAEWCRQNRLAAEADAHTQRVIELDPDHQEARRLLGYSQHRGKWMTRDQLMESRGMVRYEGSYRTRQEIELLERAKHGTEAAVNWRKQLARWRRDLGSSRPQEAMMAADAFNQLRDPAAAGALVRLLGEERNPDVQDMLIAAAARIDHPATVQTLATLSLNSPRHEVRQQCLEHLVKAQRPGLAEIYVRSLKSKNNQIVNRAGNALRVVGSQETVGALIKALTTVHEYKTGPDTPKDTYSMDSRGGFSFGGGEAPTVKVEQRNPDVRTALVELTGENFGFDKQAWRRWLANRTTTDVVDLRRDQ